MYQAIVARQRRFFSIVEEFFERVTGDDLATFKARGQFDVVIRERATAMAPRGHASFEWFESTLRSLYSEEWRQAFRDAREVGGMKLVLGGSSRLSLGGLAAIRKMLLYADTILLADPILPWLETERKEERFPLVHVIEQAFLLLHLKPFVDVDLPFPAILVFPSWEKGLEAHDPITRQGQFNLAALVIGHHINEHFGSVDELKDFASQNSAEFLRRVDDSRLFIAPGAKAAEPLEAGIQRYLDQVGTWRTQERAYLYECASRRHG